MVLFIALLYLVQHALFVISKYYIISSCSSAFNCTARLFFLDSSVSSSSMYDIFRLNTRCPCPSPLAPLLPVVDFALDAACSRRFDQYIQESGRVFERDHGENVRMLYSVHGVARTCVYSSLSSTIALSIGFILCVAFLPLTTASVICVSTMSPTRNSCGFAGI